MEKYIKPFLILLMLNQFECQVNIFGINGPAVIENVSSYNERGVSVVNVINGFGDNDNSPEAAKETNDPGVVNEVSPTVATSSPVVNQQTSSVTSYDVRVASGTVKAENYLDNGPVVNANTKNVNNNVKSNTYSTKRPQIAASQHKTTTPQVVKKTEEPSRLQSNGKQKIDNHLSHNPTTKKPSTHDDTKIYFPKS